MVIEERGAIGSDGAAEIVATPQDEGEAAHWVARMLARVPRRAIFGQVGWVTGSYAFTQAMRLVTNVVLAKLLAPQLFGVMLIINTLRTGLELLSDIGISHNIISNPRGGEPAFYNTAFTLQVIRGFALAVVAVFAAGPVIRLYDDPELALLIPLMPILFVLTGLQAPSRFLMMKRGEVRTYAFSDIALAIGSLVINAGLALYTPTIWALFIGLVLTSLLYTVITHVLMDRGTLKLQIDRVCAGQIVSFGKWVFVSSLIYFLAVNYDRLYFAKVVPFAVLGIYGVARTFSDAAGQLVQRLGDMLVYPKIAATQLDGLALRKIVAPIRGRLLLPIVAGLALAVALSDQLIILLYDRRYHAAAFMLPILLVGIWFSILATLGDSILMGTRRPAHTARANLAKFAFTCAGLPLALHYDGMVAAIFVVAGADFVRYTSQTISQRVQGLSFLRQDAALTLTLIGMIVAWRVLFTTLDILPGFDAWWAYAEGLRVS